MSEFYLDDRPLETLTKEEYVESYERKTGEKYIEPTKEEIIKTLKEYNFSEEQIQEALRRKGFL